MTMNRDEEDREKPLRDVETGTTTTKAKTKTTAGVGVVGIGDGEEETETEKGHQVEDNISSTLFHNQIRFHQAVATGLILTYVIECILQIYLIIHCCRSSFIFFTSASWDWSWFLGLNFLVSSVVVTVVSIVWVWRGDLDFAGRFVGMLICYLMHSLLLGLLWRYLKLAFVYDRADVQEFVALRIFQAFFQSLPLISIHLAWLIGNRENWSSVGLGIVLVEFLSVLTALILSSYIKSEDQRLKSKGQVEVMEIIVKNLNCSNKNPTTMTITPTQTTRTTNTNTNSPCCCSSSSSSSSSSKKSTLWPQIFETRLLYIVSRSLLLSSRLLVIAIAIVHLKYWIFMFILAHFMLSFTWISFSVNNHSSSSRKNLLEEMEEVSLTKGRDFFTLVTEWSYVLFWDVTSTIKNTVHSTVPATWILLPVLLVIVENGAMILFHWYSFKDEEPGNENSNSNSNLNGFGFGNVSGEQHRLVTIVSGSCLLLGWLLFSSLNFISTYRRVTKDCCSLHNHTSNHHNHKEVEAGGGGGMMATNNTTTTINSTNHSTTTAEDKSQQTHNSCLSVIDPSTMTTTMMMMKNSTANNNTTHNHYHNYSRGSDDVKSTVQWNSNSNSSNNNGKKIPALWDHRSLFTSTTPTALPNNYYNNINEVLVTRSSKTDTTVKHEKVERNGRKSKTGSPETLTHSPVPLVPPVPPHPPALHQHSTSIPTPTQNSATWIPDCNDSNGSSNSRNTNTLREVGMGNAILADMDIENETDIDNANFVFYFPTDTSVQYSIASNSNNNTMARFQKCSDRSSSRNNNEDNNNENHTNNSTHIQTGTGTGSSRKSKKKSRSSSVSSFGNIRRYRYRTSTPIEIKQASRILVNNPYSTVPKDKVKEKKEREMAVMGMGMGVGTASIVKTNEMNNKNGTGGGGSSSVGSSSRCYCYIDKKSCQSEKDKQIQIQEQNTHQQQQQQQFQQLQLYEKLIEDSYGILICEGEPSSSSLVYNNSNSNNNNNSSSNSNSISRNHHHHHYNSSNSKKNPHQSNPTVFHTTSRKLKVLCAKCLQNHDPLLTSCLETDVDVDVGTRTHTLNSFLLPPSHSRTPQILPPVPKNFSNSIEDDDAVDDDDEEDDGVVDDDDGGDHLPSDTTDYPSETEMTCTLEGDDDQLSVSTNLSTATYTTWPHRSQNHHHNHHQNHTNSNNNNQLSMWTTSTMMPQSRFPKEFTSLEYVRTWLLTSQARSNQQQQQQSYKYSKSNNIRPLSHHNQNQHQIVYNNNSNQGRVAKKVCRANTMSAQLSQNQNRKVRFVGESQEIENRKIQAKLKHGHHQPSHNHKNNNNNGTTGIGLCSQAQFSFQPPPKQKQHPVLPHIAHTNCHNNNNISCTSNNNNESSSDMFYKDVEIIL